MNRKLTLAALLCAALVTPALAQQNSTTSAQGQVSQVPPALSAPYGDYPPPQDRDPQRYATLNSINSGDYANSYLIYHLRMAYASSIESNNDHLNGGSEIQSYFSRGTYASTNGYLSNLGTERARYEQNYEVQYLRNNSPPYFPLADIPMPSSLAGPRPQSGYENAGTASLRTYAQTVVPQQLRLADLLRSQAIQSNNPDLLASANRLVLDARAEQANANRVLQLSEAYQGRAFTSEAAAQSYVREREEMLRHAEQTNIDSLNYTAQFGLNGYGSSSGPLVAPGRFELNASALAGALQSELGPREAEAFAARYDAQLLRITATSSNIRDLPKPMPYFEGVPMHRPNEGSLSENNPYLIARAYGDPYLGPRGQYTNGSAAQAGAAAGALGNAGSAAGGALANQGQSSAGRTASADATEAAAAAARDGFSQTTEDIDQPEPVPTHPDYPTVSAEERARISREAAERRAAQQAEADRLAAADRAARQAAAQEAAERAAMVERARIADEQYRLMLAAQRQAASDNRFVQMSRDRFGPGAWAAFADGQTVTALQLEAIYAGYDPLRAVPPGMSLSSAGNSLSSAGWSLSLAGTDWRDPALQSLYEAMGLFDYRSRSNPWASGEIDPARAAQLAYNAGVFDVRRNIGGRENYETGGYLAASLFDAEDPYLRALTANGIGGLNALLAQPFNVILTWGDGAYDLDLHMTGPLGDAAGNRFHIYYAAAGALDQQPYASLIKDCICSAGSEVILTSALNTGGVYRVSVFNFGDQSATSTNLSNLSNATIQIVRGGMTQSVGNGTTIIGGRVILTTKVPVSGAGNTWVAVELDPKNGRITVPARIKQSTDSGSVD